MGLLVGGISLPGRQISNAMSEVIPRRRVVLGIEYLGGGYSGWQTQRHRPSIQQALEGVLSKVADHPVRLTAAGRTDAGVHAIGQVAHFDSTAERQPHQWALGANASLPVQISVRWAATVQPAFHARHSALWRSYRYLIISQRARPAIWHGRVCWHHYPLNAARMHRAAQALLGEHDFSGYRAAGCQSHTPWRRVDRIAVRRRGPLVTIDIRANAFLHHMVRNIAGVLMAIGRGEAGEQWAAEVLRSRSRVLGGITAPAEGLYLREVGYPPEFALPRPAPHPWRLGL